MSSTTAQGDRHIKVDPPLDHHSWDFLEKLNRKVGEPIAKWEGGYVCVELEGKIYKVSPSGIYLKHDTPA